MERSQPALKHWRAFGAAEWTHVRDGAVGLVLGSLLPVALFYVAYRNFGFVTAVVVVLGWSTAIFAVHLRRTGAHDVFSATTFGFACVKAVAGVVSGNPLVYLAWPSLENVIYGTAFFGSALAGRPLLALYAQRLYPIPDAVRTSPAFRRAFLIASSAWLIGHGCRAILRLWLLHTLPLEVYLVADTVAGWPINGGLVAFTAWYPLRALRRAGYLGLQPRDISGLDAVELAVEETAPTTV